MSPRPRVFIRSKDLKRIVGRHLVLSKPLERRFVGLEKALSTASAIRFDGGFSICGGGTEKRSFMRPTLLFLSAPRGRRASGISSILYCRADTDSSWIPLSVLFIGSVFCFGRRVGPGFVGVNAAGPGAIKPWGLGRRRRWPGIVNAGLLTLQLNHGSAKSSTKRAVEAKRREMDEAVNGGGLDGAAFHHSRKARCSRIGTGGRQHHPATGTALVVQR